MNSKQKGATWERFVVKTLSEWSGIPMRRTFGSGANKEAFIQAHELGDIRPKDPDNFTRFPFIVECKFYKSLPYHLLNHPNGCATVDEWIDQALSDFNRAVAANVGRKLILPMIVMKTNQVSPWVGVYVPKKRSRFSSGWVNFVAYGDWVFVDLSVLTSIRYDQFLTEVGSYAMV